MVVALLAALAFQHHAPAAAALSARGPDLPAVVTHDNRRPAGTLTGGVLHLSVRAGMGLWWPQGEAGPVRRIEAFGEEPGPLSIPAPLVRVPEGTEIVAAIRNDLESPLRVHGFCERGGAACAPIEIPAGDSRQVRFRSGRAGTYHYWATTTGMPQAFRGADDTQLSGAFIVDAAGTSPDADRVFVITEWSSLTRDQLFAIARQDDPGAAFLDLRPDVLFLMNGRAWPYTERLTYALGEPVRWRIVNLSTQVHPMHLHGFYFDVESTGDGTRNTSFAEGSAPHVVTQVMPPGSTLGMQWIPEREGNWLFHCHVMTHVSPMLHVDGSIKEGGHADHAAHDVSAGMTGMVLGITVTSGTTAGAWRADAPAVPARKLTLLMQADPNRFGRAPALGFVDPAHTPLDRVPVPGPILVLKRGEPVEITLVNRLPEGTAIHWHGMELESFYDGVHGWSGHGRRITPLIEPGQSFVVRFTPPRAGTFIYHTHLHDRRQLTSGMYGAMLVLEPGETFDETTDHVFVIGRHGPDPDAPTVINGERAPTVTWKAGVRHRVRLINITPDDIFTVTLQTGRGPVMWQPLAKDASAVPTDRRQAKDATQLIAVGETYDFEFQAPPGRQTLWLEVRTGGGKWQAQGHVIVR